MKRSIVLAVFTLLFLVSAQTEAQRKMNNLSSAPGAFSRIGFGARGIGMGNALSTVKSGNLFTYYNPALSVFQEDNSFNAQYTFLGLDRSLNFVSFTRRFDFYSKNDTIPGQRKPRSTAGVSAGLINAGVSNIDQRDNQGFKKGTISTSENMFYLSLANKFSEKLAVGVTAKFYYYKLYEEVNSTSLGFDIGAIYTFNPDLSVSLSALFSCTGSFRNDQTGIACEILDRGEPVDLDDLKTDRGGQRLTDSRIALEYGNLIAINGHLLQASGDESLGTE